MPFEWFFVGMLSWQHAEDRSLLSAYRTYGCKPAEATVNPEVTGRSYRREIHIDARPTSRDLAASIQGAATPSEGKGAE